MTARITLALLFIVPAAMAYPWPSLRDRWLLGIAVVAVIVLVAWWRGAFLTTIVGRRIAMWLRRNSKASLRHSPAYTTVLLCVDASNPLDLPLDVIASYLNRYGIRCDKVRVTNRDVGGHHTTWIGLTLGAASNLTALQARSPRIPLRDTAEVVARRLAEHLRERGWNVSIAVSAEMPTHDAVKETWRGLRGETGYVAAYGVRVDDRLADTLGEIRSLPSVEAWTAVEYTGGPTNPEITAACALRTVERPSTRAPIRGLTPLSGRHGRALGALNPQSTDRLIRT